MSVRWVAVHRTSSPGRQFADEQVEGPFWPTAPPRLPRPWAPMPPSPLTGSSSRRPSVPGRRDRHVGGAAAHRADARLSTSSAARRPAGPRPISRPAAAQGGGDGCDGFARLGTHPVPHDRGHQVTQISREAHTPAESPGDPAKGRLDPERLEVGPVVHLAGENVGARWTQARKRRIAESRIQGTRFLAETLARLRRPPKVLISASAIGAYGDQGTRSSPSPAPSRRAGRTSSSSSGGNGKRRPNRRVPRGSASCCPASASFDPSGRGPQRMLRPFRLGVGGRIGSGRQWVGWIAVDDAVGAVHQALMHDSLSGPVNATAPAPVTSREFAATLGRTLGRPAIVPAQLSPCASSSARWPIRPCSSQRVLPGRLNDSGYRFRYPELAGALRHVRGGNRRAPLSC